MRLNMQLLIFGSGCSSLIRYSCRWQRRTDSPEYARRNIQTVYLNTSGAHARPQGTGNGLVLARSWQNCMEEIEYGHPKIATALC